MFETNLRDERFLPFEGAGAVSTWKLELPRNFRAFDYQISDVILHLRYTARQGVDAAKVTGALGDLFKQSPQSNLAILSSLRHEFASEWSKFADGAGDFSVRIRLYFFLTLCRTRGSMWWELISTTERTFPSIARSPSPRRPATT